MSSTCITTNNIADDVIYSVHSGMLKEEAYNSDGHFIDSLEYVCDYAKQNPNRLVTTAIAKNLYSNFSDYISWTRDIPTPDSDKRIFSGAQFGSPGTATYQYYVYVGCSIDRSDATFSSCSIEYETDDEHVTTTLDSVKDVKRLGQFSEGTNVKVTTKLTYTVNGKESTTTTTSTLNNLNEDKMVIVRTMNDQGTFEDSYNYYAVLVNLTKTNMHYVQIDTEATTANINNDFKPYTAQLVNLGKYGNTESRSQQILSFLSDDDRQSYQILNPSCRASGGDTINPIKYIVPQYN